MCLNKCEAKVIPSLYIEVALCSFFNRKPALLMPAKLISLYFLLATLSLVSCSKNLYRKALTDAARPTPGKVSTNLTAISNNNTTLCRKQFRNKDSIPEDYVLVASWKKDVTRYHND